MNFNKIIIQAKNILHKDDVAVVVLLYLFSVFILSINIYTKPGLHFDEAWAGLQTAGIIKNPHIVFSGMNNYTGSLFNYLRVPFFLLLGKSVFSLRLLSIIFNALATPLIFLLIKNKIKNTFASTIAAATFFFTPWFFIESRIAWEVCFFPTLFLLILYLLSQKGKIWIFLAAFLAALGFWTHGLFAIAIIPLIIFMFYYSQIYFRRNFLIISAGFGLGLLPKLYQQSFEGGTSIVIPIITNIKSLPEKTLIFVKLDMQMISGNVLFQRMTGAVKVDFYNYTIGLIILILCLGLIIIFIKGKKRMLWVSVLAFLASVLVLFIIAPHLIGRYVLIPLTILGLFFSYIVALMISYNKKLVVLPILLILVFIINIQINFLGNQNLRTAHFPFGDIIDTSDHFLLSKNFYDCLSDKYNYKKISADDVDIIWPLKFYDFDQHRLQISDNPSSYDDNEIIITYNDKFLPLPKINVICPDGQYFHFYSATIRPQVQNERE